MSIRGRITIVLLCALLQPASTLGQSLPRLALRPEVLESKYCLGKNGLVTLHLRLKLEFKNNGEIPVILLDATPLLGFTLRSAENAGGPISEISQQYPRPRIIDMSKENDPAPDPAIVAVLQPGELSLREEELSIPLKKVSPPASLLGTEQDLTIRVNPWPDKRRIGETLRQRWTRTGLLWLEPIASSAVKIHIERSPQIAACTPKAIF